MNVLLIDNGTTLLSKLEQLIPGREVVQTWRDFTPEQVEAADLIVLSGGSSEQLVGNESDFDKELALIRTTTKPLIGICFGCELIAVAFGGTLRTLPERHQGIRQIRMLAPELAGGKGEIEVFENHEWIIDALPEGFDVLAESEEGPEMIKHRERPLYGLQFHPENRVETADGDEVFRAILTSLLLR